MQKRFGKFGIVIPKYAVGSSPHCSRSDTLFRPVTSIDARKSLCWKPVA